MPKNAHAMLLRAIGLAALLAGAGGPPALAAPIPVALELVLAVDASGSVSEQEFELQMRGLADAFRDPQVVAAIAGAGPGGIAVALVQWSSPGQQVVAVDWLKVSDAASAGALAARIDAAGRLIQGETAIDGALRFSLELLASADFASRRRIIDLSGDGQTNWGPDPDEERDRVVAAGVTINALAVVNEQPHLGGYYRKHVIGGPDCFVMTAADYADFARAIRLKLIREIGNAPIAGTPAGRTTVAGSAQ